MKVTAASGPDARRTGRIRFVGIAVLVAIAALIGLESSVTSRLKSVWFDAYQSVAPRNVRSMPATVVEIDQKSLAAIGQWPWPRTVMAELVEAIRRERPAAIALDILMPEADALSPERLLARTGIEDKALARALAGRPSNDEVFARALTAAGAVLVVAGTTEATGMPLRAPPFTVHEAGGSDSASVPVSLRIARYPGVLTSIDTLDRAASGHGLISVDAEGGTIRRVPLVAKVDGELVPTLAIEMLRVTMGAASVGLHVSGSTVQAVSTGDFIVPTEADGAVRIYYSGRNAARFVSAIDVLDHKVDPARLAQKLVLIGVTGIGIIEYQNTPVGERMPGSEIHAQLLENLYDDTLLRRPDWAPWLETAVFLLLGALLVYGTPRWKPRTSVVIALGSLAFMAISGYLAFRSQRLLFDAAVPGVGLALLFGLLLVLALAEASSERRHIRRVFQRYLSPQMVDRLVNNPKLPELGGELRELTILFCDVRGFTALSESLDPAALSRVVNGFFAAATEAILERGGTVDKYIGDAVMAFWNAPMDQPDHAVLACRAALRLGENVERLNDSMAHEGNLPRLRVGIGINTGLCTVGNFGSSRRFDYSAIGDAVNVAARLEGEAKTYGVAIVLGPATAACVPDFATLPIDSIRPRGRAEALEIHALVGDEKTMDTPEFRSFRSLHLEWRTHSSTRDAESLRRIVHELKERAPSGLKPLYEPSGLPAPETHSYGGFR